MDRPASPASANIRRAKACNTCRRKKVKCDRKRPVCSSCSAFGLNCVFQDQPKRPSRSSRVYVHHLESRLHALEDQLRRREGLCSTLDTDLESSLSPSMLMDNDNMIRQAPAAPNGGIDVEPSAESPDEDEMLCSNSAANPSTGGADSNNEKLRFFGNSSSFSLTSLDSPSLGGELRGEGRRVFGRRSIDRWQASDWIPRPLRDSFEHRVSQKLPSKEVTIQLVDEYFAQCNSTLPLFERNKFMQSLERQFSWNPDESPSWWASLNVVLAFSYRDRAETSQNQADDWNLAFGHLRNALNVSTELFMRVTDLLAVQAMLGLALFFQNTPNPQPLFMYCSAAMRIGQSLGFHKQDTYRFTPADVETRRRVFWIAFILDADVSYRTGRPAAQDINDYDTPLPAKQSPDGIGTVDINGMRINFFYLLARFALIQRQAYNDLYSAAASKASAGDFARNVTKVSRELAEWTVLIPEKLRPQHSHHIQYSFSTRGILRLYFAYHWCNSNLFRASLMIKQSLRASATNQQGRAALDKDIGPISSSALDSARTVIRMMENMGEADFSFLWGIVYFYAATCVPLCLQILSEPHLPHADSDLGLVHRTTNFLSRVVLREPNTYLDWVLDLCIKLESAAQLVRKQSMTQPPRVHAGSTTVRNSLSQGADMNTDPVTAHMWQLDSDGLDSSLSHNFSTGCGTPEWGIGPLWPLDSYWALPPDGISVLGPSGMIYGPFSGMQELAQDMQNTT